MSLLVSIHDVTPRYQSEVEQLWSLCQHRALSPALLVVPNWHGSWPLERHSVFADWLRARAVEGAEIVLHGFRHDEIGSPRGWRDSLRAWQCTVAEGEFLTLDRMAAREKIELGLAALRAVGLEALGFVPPAWLAREAGHAAAGDAGLHFSEDDRSIRLFPGGIPIASPACRWSARTAVRARTSALVAEVRWRLQRGTAVARIALHPTDLNHPTTERSVVRVLDRWVAHRRPSSYASLLATYSSTSEPPAPEPTRAAES